MSKYIVRVNGPKGSERKYTIEAINATTALQVAASRDRELAKIERFMGNPS